MFEYLQYQIIDVLQKRQEKGTPVFNECISVCSRTEGVMAIAPYISIIVNPENLQLKDIPVLRLSDEIRLEGTRQPNQEFRVHKEIYQQNPQISSIIHVNTNSVIAYSNLGKKLPVYGKYHATHFKTAIKSIGETVEEKVVNSIIQFIGSQEDKTEGAVFIKGDGALIWSKTVEEIIKKANALEQICEIALKTSMDASELSHELCFKYYEEAQKKKNYFKELHPVSGNVVTEEEKRLISINLLKYFNEFCRKEGIYYSMTGGTLLGAIRHKGFIPWDDDIDLFLTRPEYEKLIRIFPKEGRYRLYNREIEKDYAYVWSRLIDTRTIIEKSPNCAAFGKGIFIDICVVDGLPKSVVFRKLHIFHIWILFRLRRCCIQNPNTKRYKEKGRFFVLLKKIVNKISSMEYWNCRLEKTMKKYKFDQSDYVGNFVSSGYGKRELLHRDVFSGYSDMEFEGITAMVCDGYEEYLNSIYGNYMELPPLSKRMGHHVSDAYWV